MTQQEIYMQRCLQLARAGEGAVAPNPMVGAVLVHEERIIGEGYHRKYGEAHAEVNCLDSVRDEDKGLISLSTLYVSLEPCSHFGKTPPCSDLIIVNGIKKVVVGCRDPFVKVNGKGIEKLKKAGIEVVVGVCEDQCRDINKAFFTFHTKHRPFITLKWAQSADGFIAGEHGKRVKISNEQTDRLMHKLRATHSAIVVGTNTALFDDPELTTRFWTGRNPLRYVLDMNLRLPASLKLFNGDHLTIVFNKTREEAHVNLAYQRIDAAQGTAEQMILRWEQHGIQSVLVEGGAQLLQTFIDKGLWDEAVVVRNEKLCLGKGIAAPTLKNGCLKHSEQFLSDRIEYYTNNNS